MPPPQALPIAIRKVRGSCRRNIDLIDPDSALTFPIAGVVTTPRLRSIIFSVMLRTTEKILFILSHKTSVDVVDEGLDVVSEFTPAGPLRVEMLSRCGVIGVQPEHLPVAQVRAFCGPTPWRRLVPHYGRYPSPGLVALAHDDVGTEQLKFSTEVLSTVIEQPLIGLPSARLVLTALRGVRMHEIRLRLPRCHAGSENPVEDACSELVGSVPVTILPAEGIRDGLVTYRLRQPFRRIGFGAPRVQ